MVPAGRLKDASVCPWTLLTADLQPQECQSSLVLVAFLYLLIYFTSLHSYCDIAVCKRKGFGVDIVLTYTQHLTDTKYFGAAVFGSISVVLVNYFELIIK